jgi:hypothetical protein
MIFHNILSLLAAGLLNGFTLLLPSIIGVSADDLRVPMPS